LLLLLPSSNSLNFPSKPITRPLPSLLPKCHFYPLCLPCFVHGFCCNLGQMSFPPHALSRCLTLSSPEAGCFCSFVHLHGPAWGPTHWCSAVTDEGVVEGARIMQRSVLVLTSQLP
jgi:hypothetical protein